MARILTKSGFVAFASLFIALTVVPALGVVVDGNAILMCIVCPQAIARPASAYLAAMDRGFSAAA